MKNQDWRQQWIVVNLPDSSTLEQEEGPKTSEPTSTLSSWPTTSLVLFSKTPMRSLFPQKSGPSEAVGVG